MPLLDYADEIAPAIKPRKKKQLSYAELRAANRRDLYWRLAFAFVGFGLLVVYELDRECLENPLATCLASETFQGE